MLLKLDFRLVAVVWAALMVDGWLSVVSLSVNGVLFKLMVRAGAVGWQLWMALMVDVVLFGVGLVVASLMVNVWLFKLGRRLVAV